MTFELEHAIIAKRDRMERMVARHNQLVAILPKELTQERVDEFQMTLAEIDSNMKALLALVAELEADCKRLEVFRPTSTIPVFRSSPE